MLRLPLLVTVLACVLAGCPARSGFDDATADLGQGDDPTTMGDSGDDVGDGAGDGDSGGDPAADNDPGDGVVFVQPRFRMAYDRTWIILQLDQQMAPLSPEASLPATYSITPALPAGLTFDTSDGTIAGQPTNAVPLFTSFQVSAIAGNLTAVRQLRLAVVGGFVVDTTSDLGPTGTLGDGTCAPPGQCSIRAALAEADALSGIQGVFVPPGTYAITGVIALTSDVLVGPRGGAPAILDSSGANFTMFNVVAGERVLLSDLEVSSGVLTGGDGGCFAIAGTTDVSHLHIHDCQAGRGAGVAVTGSGSLTMEASRMTDNIASDNGGAIYTVGNAVLLLSTSSLSDNQAPQGAAVSSGGVTTTIDGCYFGDNISQSGGGGVLIKPGSEVSIMSSTFDGNSSVTARAGALLSYGGLTVDYSTFGHNTSGASGQVISVQGGAASMHGTLMFAQTDPCDTDDFGFTSLGYNVYDGSLGACPDLSATTDVTNASLGTFSGSAANNGGPTLSVAIDTQGAAHDIGDLSCPSFDQRGEPRPAPGLGATCDAGAYEVGVLIN